MRALTLSLALASALASAAAFATPAAVATETDEAKFIRLTHAVEADPLAFARTPELDWLVHWLTEAPDVNVLLCNPSGLMDGPEGDEQSALLLLEMFGNAAWQIEHQGEPVDEVARQLAGARSALRGYEALRKANPALHVAAYDTLAAQEAAGTLEAYFAPRALEACTKDEDGAK